MVLGGKLSAVWVHSRLGKGGGALEDGRETDVPLRGQISRLAGSKWKCLNQVGEQSKQISGKGTHGISRC